jgi:hypothetical protein
MSRGPTDLPERLVAGDATDFERRVLGAALQKRPSDLASGRMARALGVTVTGIGAAAGAKALAAEAAVSKATVAAGSSLVWPWVSAAVVGLVVAGAVVSARVWHAPRPEVAPKLAPVAVASAPNQPVVPLAAAPKADAPPVPAAPRHRLRGPAVEGDLRDQIALVDQARETLSTGSPQRALELLRRYQDRYPSGSFRPEATALTIEAFVKVGRDAEARALATRFVAEHRGSLLAARVAELVGLSVPAAAP